MAQNWVNVGQELHRELLAAAAVQVFFNRISTIQHTFESSTSVGIQAVYNQVAQAIGNATNQTVKSSNQPTGIDILEGLIIAGCAIPNEVTEGALTAALGLVEFTSQMMKKPDGTDYRLATALQSLGSAAMGVMDQVEAARSTLSANIFGDYNRLVTIGTHLASATSTSDSYWYGDDANDGFVEQQMYNSAEVGYYKLILPQFYEEMSGRDAILPGVADWGEQYGQMNAVAAVPEASLNSQSSWADDQVAAGYDGLIGFQSYNVAVIALRPMLGSTYYGQATPVPASIVQSIESLGVSKAEIFRQWQFPQTTCQLLYQSGDWIPTKSWTNAAYCYHH